jgi:hypothetical protein
MKDATRRRVMRHGGEFLRELALLVLVFYPLDVYVQYRALPLAEFAIAFGASMILWIGGFSMMYAARVALTDSVRMRSRLLEGFISYRFHRQG